LDEESLMSLLVQDALFPFFFSYPFFFSPLSLLLPATLFQRGYKGKNAARSRWPCFIIPYSSFFFPFSFFSFFFFFFFFFFFLCSAQQMRDFPFLYFSFSFLSFFFPFFSFFLPFLLSSPFPGSSSFSTELIQEPGIVRQQRRGKHSASSFFSFSFFVI